MHYPAPTPMRPIAENFYDDDDDDEVDDEDNRSSSSEAPSENEAKEELKVSLITLLPPWAPCTHVIPATPD